MGRKKWAIPDFFLFTFVFSIQLKVHKNLQMARFEPPTSVFWILHGLSIFGGAMAN